MGKSAFLVLTLLVSLFAQAHPKFEPAVRTPQECEQKGGDWNPDLRLCTIYVSGGADGEGDPGEEPAKPTYLADGCYQIYDLYQDEIADVGVICLDGLTNESVGMHLRIVYVNAVGRARFCGESTDFSTLPAGSNANLLIHLEQPSSDIHFAGTDKAGRVTIGRLALKYKFLPTMASVRFFELCE